MADKLLIIDDEEGILFALCEYFTLGGYEVDCARTAGEAEALLRSGGYAVVLADLRLTGSDSTEGLALLREARARSPSTRTVLLTAFGTAEVEREVRRQGIDLLLHKPQPLPSIARRIAALDAARP